MTKVKTQTAYDKEQAELKALRDEYIHGRLSRDMTQAQLCLMGFSPERALVRIRNWREEYYESKEQ